MWASLYGGPLLVRFVRTWINKISFLFRIVGAGVQTGSTRHVGHFWPLVLAPGDFEDEEFGRIKIGRGNRSTWRKPAPAPLFSPQIPLDQILARTRTAAVVRQQLTAWAMARPWNNLSAIYGRNIVIFPYLVSAIEVLVISPFSFRSVSVAAYRRLYCGVFSRMRELLKREASKQKKNECL
jgi:hypothetical protein